MKGPTQRSLNLMRKYKYDVAVVERWNQFAKIRQDLFNFIDIIAMNPTVGIIGIQTTTLSNIGKRVEKIREIERASTWLLSGGIIQVHGWRKLKVKNKDGKKGAREKWECKILNLSVSEENNEIVESEVQTESLATIET